MKIRKLIAVPMIILIFCAANGCAQLKIPHHSSDEFTQQHTLNEHEITERSTQDITNTETDTASDDSATINSAPTQYDFTEYTYYYDLLSAEDKTLYDRIYNTISSHTESIDINVSKDSLDRCYKSVIRDHPELYYASSYTYSYTTDNSNTARSFIPKYDYSADEVKNRQLQTDTVVTDFMTNAPINGSEYEKVKYIYEYLADHVVYDKTVSSNQTLYDALVSGRCVCNGYAESVKYLCDRLGVKSLYVGGTGKDENNGWQPHSWNIVNIKNYWYAVDATWGDKQIEGNGTVFSEVMYDYLCVSDDVMTVNHKNDDFITYPICNSDDLNYYKLNGTYITNTSDEAIKYIFRNVQTESGGYVILKCASESLVNELKTKLIDDKEIFDYIDEMSANSLIYSNVNVIVFYW